MLLILYLMQNRTVQTKAQREIDRVVGSERLPTWEDLPSPPYTNLILQETYRMNPLSPLGIPHASVADDVYNNMFIPKGTIVYQNVWAMHHDESVYSDPFSFWPERYLSKEQEGKANRCRSETLGSADGMLFRPCIEVGDELTRRFQSRICIGRNLAENSLLVVLATMLATLDIDWPPGPDGLPEVLEPEWSFRGQAYGSIAFIWAAAHANLEIAPSYPSKLR